MSCFAQSEAKCQNVLLEFSLTDDSNLHNVLFNPQNNLGSRPCCHLHFTNEETESERGQVACLKPHRAQGTGGDLSPGGAAPEDASPLGHLQPRHGAHAAASQKTLGNDQISKVKGNTG